MELFEAIKTRRSVRAFSDKEILKEDLERIIDAGRWAPSACNVQGWRFIVIKDQKTKRRLIDLGAASFLEKAPVGITVAYDNRTDNLEYMDYVQSASACIQNMILAAHSLGVGSCWICHLPRKKEMRDCLDIPGHYDPIAYLALGYSQREPRSKERRESLEELISYDRYRSKREVKGSRIKLALKRFMRKMFYLLPFRKHMAKKANERFEKRFD
ncbi:MAG: nitroreductase family protein [Candidatus Altiarchaeota archaeon]|nr:nitroreductase family protein [Candidatus Altiarchaeota archaeon]